MSKAHTFSKWVKSSSGSIFRMYCVRCGLVQLKNKATEQAIKKGCDG